ncbi:MAG: FkbM family methyltransferase [Rhodospirillaceae bacterium]
MNLKEAIQIAVKASSEGKFDIAERTCREILKHLEAYIDDGIRFSVFTSVSRVLAIILTHVGRLDEASNILRRLYISTLSSKSLEYSLLNARKQGCLDDFGKFDDWLSIQSGKAGMVRGLIDQNRKMISPLVPQIEAALRNISPGNDMSVPYLEGTHYQITGDAEYVNKIDKILRFIYPTKRFCKNTLAGTEKYYVTLDHLGTTPVKHATITIPVTHGHAASFWSGLENVIQNGDVTTESIVSALVMSRAVLGLNYLKEEDLLRIQTDPRKQVALHIFADKESCDSYNETVSGQFDERHLSYYSTLVNHTQYFDYISRKTNAVILNIGVAEGFELPALLQFYGETSKIYNIDPDGYSNLTPASRDCIDRNPKVFDLLSVAVSDSNGALEMDTGAMAEDVRVARRNTGVIKSVPCNRLNTIVKSIGTHRVDLIKVDIEGGEEFILDDLISVANKYRPEICLSVYHQVDHIFDMPLKMAAELENYKFYFKRYSPVFEEATLYCIPD